MKVFMVAAAALLLGACASNGYRYHEDGYWSATARPSTSIVVYDSCFGARGYGYGPSWHSWHPCSGYAYGPYFGYGGYFALYDPFWPYSHRWPRHWHGGSHGQHASSRFRAFDEARRMGASMGDTSERSFTRYENLGPLRRRDLGPGGGAAGRDYAESYGPRRSPSYSQGLSGNDRGFGRPSNSAGLGSSRDNSNSGGGMDSGSSSSSSGSSRSSDSGSSRESVSSSRSRQSED